MSGEAPSWDDIPDWDSVPDAPEQQPAQQPSATSTQPPAWDDIPDWDNLPDHQRPEAEGALASGARAAAHSVAPTIGSLPAMGAGAALGGAFGGPIGAFAGGIAGAIGGGYAISKAQDWVGKQLGFDDADQLAANAEAHPIATGVGELVPAAAAFRPDLVGAKLLQRAAGGGIMGGLELGQEAAGDQPISPGKVAGAAAFGAVFTKPTAMGEAAMNLGGKLASRLRSGVPQTAPGSSAEAPPPAEDVTGDGFTATRSERDYGVAKPAAGDNQVTTGIMDPATMDALQAGLDRNDLRKNDDLGTVPGKEPEEQLPLNTGIAEAAAQQGAPAPVTAAVTPPEPTPDQLGAQRVRRQKTLSLKKPPAEEPPVETGIVEASKEPPPNWDDIPAPTAAPEVASTFQTAKGSTYDLHPDGTTTRNKAERPDPGHEGDFGLKPQSAKTVFVTPEQANALAIPQDSHFALIDHGDGTLSLATQNKDGQYGISPDQRNIPYSTEPAVGLHPLEAFEPRTVQGEQGYGVVHTGNKIVSVGEAAPRAPAADVTPASDAAPTPGARAKTLTLNKNIAAAAKEVNRNPTEGQKGAGNYKKGHVNIEGLDVSIENPRGSLRKGVDENGEPWSVKMPDHYGYIRKTEGADGDHVDAYIGKGDKHFIADQYDAKTGKFDEHKLLLKQPDRETALANYEKAFSDGKGADRLGSVREVTMPELKGWLKGDTTKAANGEADFPLRNKPLDLTGFTEGVRVQPGRGKPKVVETTIAKLREKGMAKAADAIEALPPEKQAIEAVRASAMLTNKTGKVPNSVTRVRARPPAPEFKVGDTTVTGRSKADIEQKTQSLKAVADAFEKHPPVEGETKEAAVTRLQNALMSAEKELKRDPLAYKPRVPPKEWLWMREARRFLTGSKTDAAYNKFTSNELQLRSGNPEDVANVRNTNRIEGDIGRSTTAGDDAIAAAENQHAQENPYLDVPHEEAETMVKPEPIESPADIKPVGQRKLDLTTEEGRAEAAQQSQKIVDNLIKAEDAGEQKIPQWQKDAEDRAANMDKQRRAREAAQLAGKKSGKAVGESEGAASPVRKIKVDAESAKAALAALEKAQARDKARAQGMDALPAERDPTQITEESKLKAFWNNESGSLNLNKIRNQFKVMAKPVKASLEKYFGVPMTDIGIKIDAVLARTMSATSKWNSEKAHLLDARWYQWMKGASKPDVMKYLSVLEDPANKTRADVKSALLSAGVDAKKADWMADEAEMHRDLMDKIWLEDRAHGSDADYIANYVPHIFKDSKGAAAFIESRIKALGATWYQKVRTFDMIADAEKAGFKLKFENPIDIIGARWAASINSNMLVNAARGLQDIGAAFPVKDAPAFAKKNWMFKRQLPDGQQWAFAPEAENLWMNAMEAKGLTQMDGPIGSTFRNWMKLKNVWVPIQLSLSAFHPVHVIANINVAQNLTTALKLSAAGKGNPAGNLLRAAKWSLSDSLFSMPIDKIGYGLGKSLDAMAGNRFSEYAGRKAQNWWEVPHDQLTPEGKMWSQLFAEGGVAPHQAAEEVIGAKRAWAQAINDKAYIKAIPAGIRRAIEKVQEPLFKYQIPALKNTAYMRAVSAAMQIDPSLVNDNVRRGVALREIGKSIDDRYGEMFYKSLFWNRYVKDLGIGSMLSLSWNLGQARQLNGAVGNVLRASRLAGGKNGLGSPMQEARYRASDKATFVSSYVGLSMASAGLLSYALTGQIPTGLDYFFPRNGETNPDGGPQRLSTPFNTREPFMLKGHAEQHNSWVGGALEFLWNKMILSPITEAMQNRDFYGQKLYDVNAPWYKKALQGIDSTLGAHFSPIAISGADRARQQGGSPALAYVGFGPAPKYINATPMENRINAQFSEEGTPTSKPYEYGKKTGLGRGLVQGGVRALNDDPLPSEARKTDRAKLDLANRKGDVDAAMKARRDLITNGGMSARTASRLDPRQEFQYKFARLPAETQMSLARDMTTAEFNKYVILNTNAGLQKVNKAKMMKERSLNK